MNICGIDKGALGMAKNALERAGKNEIKDALLESAIPIEKVLEQVAKECPALYMTFVNEQMMKNYT